MSVELEYALQRMASFCWAERVCLAVGLLVLFEGSVVGRREDSWCLIHERQVREDGKKIASVFELHFSSLLPVCIFNPSLFITLSRMVIPRIASAPELKRTAESST